MRMQSIFSKFKPVAVTPIAETTQMSVGVGEMQELAEGEYVVVSGGPEFHVGTGTDPDI